MHPLEYVRTDRNGTKYYHDWNCPRCGGVGQSDKWYFTGKICFECYGSGKRLKPAVVKEYTPEHAAKLKARQAARDAKRLAENPPPSKEELEAKAEDTRRNNWMHEGFGRDGIGYIHAGNTYKNREAIKAAGGRWTYALNAFVAPRPIDGLEGVRITEANALELCDAYGWIDWSKARELRDKI